MRKSSQADFGTGSIGKLLFSMAVPAITAQIINALYNIVDRMYIGRMEGVGKTALAGIGVSFPLIMIVSAFANLIGQGGAPLASIKVGEQKKDHAEKILSQKDIDNRELELAQARLKRALVRTSVAGR